MVGEAFLACIHRRRVLKSIFEQVGLVESASDLSLPLSIGPESLRDLPSSHGSRLMVEDESHAFSHLNGLSQN